MNTEAQWNQLYETNERLFGDQVNPLLSKHLPRLTPKSRILNIGDGEGFNSIFAAKQHFRVTSLDSAAKAQIKAQENARNAHCMFELVCSNILEWESYSDQFDLVTLFFVHVASEDKQALAEKIYSLLKPGGLFLFECFHKHQIDISNVGGFDVDQLYNEEEIAILYQDFAIESMSSKHSINYKASIGSMPTIPLQFVGLKKMNSEGN